jgi:hypothetical protein
MTIPGTSEVQQYVQEVLSRPEFNAAPPRQSGPGWILGILEWLASHRLPAIGNISIGTLILLAAAAALLAYLVVRLVRFVRGGGLNRSPARAAPGTKRAAASDVSVSAGESIRQAGAALAAGDARGAIQELLRACLAHLAGTGAIVLEKWKTNIAYTRECPPELPAFGVFRDLAQVHNDIVYAHRTPENERIRSLMADLLRQVEAS